MSYFRDALLIANDDGYSITDEGLAALYDAFEHFAKGGTIFNHPDKAPHELQIMLAVTWKDVRDYVLMREKFKQQNSEDS